MINKVASHNLKLSLIGIFSFCSIFLNAELFAAVDDYREEELTAEMIKENSSWKYVNIKQEQFIDQLSKNNAELEQDNRSLKADHDMMLVELRKTKLENKLAIFKLKTVTLDNIKLKKNLSWMKSELEKQSSSADSLAKDLYECKRNSAQFQAQAEFLEKTQMETPESFKKTKANWEAVLHKTNNEKISLENKLQNAQIEKSKITQRFNFVLKDNLKLRREIKELKAKFVNFSTVKKDLVLAKEKEEELNALVEVMKAKHAKEIESFKNANEQQQLEIEKVILDKNKTKDELISVSSQKEDLNLKLNSITKENEQMKKDLAYLQGELQNLEQEKNLGMGSLKKQTQELKEDLDNLQISKVNPLIIENKNYKVEVSDLKSEKDKLVERINIANKENSQLQLQLAQVSESLAKSNRENDRIKKDLTQKQNDLENKEQDKKVEITNLSIEKNKLLDKVDAAVKENAQLQIQVTQLISALSQTKSDLMHSNNEKTQLMEKFKLLTKENSKFKDEVAELGRLQMQLDNALAENKLLKNKLEHSEVVTVKQKEKDKPVGKDKVVALSSDGEVAKLKKESADMHYNLGVILQKDNKLDEAIQEYTKALELNAQDAGAHYNLGLIFSIYKNNRDKAIEHYRKYLELSPDEPDAQIVKVKLTQLESEQQVWGDSQAKSLGEKEKLGRW